MTDASDWPPIDPVEAGFAPDLADRLADVPEGQAPGLHGLVVIRHGRLVLEQYGAGEDFTWNESLGLVTFGPDTLHDIRSVTKSVVGLLYGIALAAGQVPARSSRCSRTSRSIPISPPIPNAPTSPSSTRSR